MEGAEKTPEVTGTRIQAAFRHEVRGGQQEGTSPTAAGWDLLWLW